jgi:hypothetical protein
LSSPKANELQSFSSQFVCCRSKHACSVGILRPAKARVIFSMRGLKAMSWRSPFLLHRVLCVLFVFFMYFAGDHAKQRISVLGLHWWALSQERANASQSQSHKNKDKHKHKQNTNKTQTQQIVALSTDWLISGGAFTASWVADYPWSASVNVSDTTGRYVPSSLDFFLLFPVVLLLYLTHRQNAGLLMVLLTLLST